MIERSQLPNLLSKSEYGRPDKVLICLACSPDDPKEVKYIRELAVSAGLRAARVWNLSQILADALGLAVRVSQGWQLTLDGRKRVSDLVGPSVAVPTSAIASVLRQ